MELEKSFEEYRKSYINCLMKNKFPWEAAYHYYKEHCEDIVVMTYTEFIQSISNKAKEIDKVATNEKESSLELISLPIYDSLEKYYNPNYVVNNNNQIIDIY